MKLFGLNNNKNGKGTGLVICLTILNNLTNSFV